MAFRWGSDPVSLGQRIRSFFCRNSGRPLMLPIALHGCRARSNLRRLSTFFKRTPEYISRDVMFRIASLGKGATDRWSGREEDDALRACPPQVWKQPNTPYLTRRIWLLLRAAVGGQGNPPSDHKDKIVDFCHLALLQIWGKSCR